MNDTFFENNACPQEEIIHRYLDEDLNPPERETFIAHLQQCSTCQTRLTGLQSLFTELASLEEIESPVEIVSQVMAALPAPDVLPQRITIGRLALLGQIIVGLGLILAAWPTAASRLDTQIIRQLWLAVSGITLSFNRWLTDLVIILNNQVPRQWPPGISLTEFNISPAAIIVLVAGLGLAWLIGNGVLLRQNPSSFKNRGTS